MDEEAERFIRDFSDFNVAQKGRGRPPGYEDMYMVYALCERFQYEEVMAMTYKEAVLWLQFIKYDGFKMVHPDG